ncbi:MAG: hypothetical protein ACXVH3_12280 [Solirubrobacteraceae bacterium]
MTNRVVQHIRSNVVAYVALFVALGGTSYAALKLPANSVGTRQIKNHAITPIKLDPSKTGAVVRFWAVVDFIPGTGEQLSSARPHARLTWNASADTGSVTWHQPIASNCFVNATSGSGLITAFVGPLRTSRAFVQFSLFSPTGQPSPGLAYITVLCPQP